MTDVDSPNDQRWSGYNTHSTGTASLNFFPRFVTDKDRRKWEKEDKEASKKRRPLGFSK